jgi:hypothetical protein
MGPVLAIAAPIVGGTIFGIAMDGLDSAINDRPYNFRCSVGINDTPETRRCYNNTQNDTLQRLIQDKKDEESLRKKREEEQIREYAIAAQKKREEERVIAVQKKREEERVIAVQKKREEERVIMAQKKREEERVIMAQKKREEERVIAAQKKKESISKLAIELQQVPKMFQRGSLIQNPKTEMKRLEASYDKGEFLRAEKVLTQMEDEQRSKWLCPREVRENVKEVLFEVFAEVVSHGTHVSVPNPLTSEEFQKFRELMKKKGMNVE